MDERETALQFSREVGAFVPPQLEMEKAFVR